MRTTPEALVYTVREIGGSITQEGDRWKISLPEGSSEAFVELLNRYAPLITVTLNNEAMQCKKMT